LVAAIDVTAREADGTTVLAVGRRLRPQYHQPQDAAAMIDYLRENPVSVCWPAPSRNFQKPARFSSGFSQKYQSTFGRPAMTDIALTKTITALMKPGRNANKVALKRSKAPAKEALNFSALAIQPKIANT
jgi:hypothetical protein